MLTSSLSSVFTEDHVSPRAPTSDDGWSFVSCSFLHRLPGPHTHTRTVTIRSCFVLQSGVHGASCLLCVSSDMVTRPSQSHLLLSLHLTSHYLCVCVRECVRMFFTHYTTPWLNLDRLCACVLVSVTQLHGCVETGTGAERLHLASLWRQCSVCLLQ